MKINLLITVLIILICTACTKKYGCTDKFAINFDIEAEVSSHSCYYNEVVKFNIRDFRMEAFIAENVHYLEVYFNDEFMITKEIDPESPSFKVPFTSYEKRRNIKLLILDNKDSVIRDNRFQMSYDDEYNLIEL